jgi:hypothetical protein
MARMPAHLDLYRAGARLARTGAGYRVARYARENNLSVSQERSMERGFIDEVVHNPKAKPGRPLGDPAITRRK